jgi:hypothetical protein
LNGGQNFDRHHRFFGAANRPGKLPPKQPVPGEVVTRSKISESTSQPFSIRSFNPVGVGVPVPAPPIAHPQTMRDAVGICEKVLP